MPAHRITLRPSNRTVDVPTGTLLAEAAQLAGLELAQPCGGQGRCGRCAVQIDGSGYRRRSTLRLSAEDLEAGFALACQTVVEGDIAVEIPPQERLQRMLVTDRVASRAEVPLLYESSAMQSLRILQLALPEPTLEDNRDDQARFLAGLADAGYPSPAVSLPVLRRLGPVLREAAWKPWVVLQQPEAQGPARLLTLAANPPKPLGLAIDIGTTTVTTYLVHLDTGEILAQAAEYNDQIARGEDVVSRIIYAGKEGGLAELADLVRRTIAALLARIRLRTGVEPGDILKVTVAGNTTMTHLFLGIPPAPIRLSPYIPTVNQPAPILGAESDLPIHPQAEVDVLPGVASYVGSDITAGALAAGLDQA